MANELKLNNPLVLGKLASDPGVAYTGEVYFNTISSVLRLYTGSTWVNIASGTVSLTGQPLNANNVIIGNSSNLSAALNTSTTGNILADATNGLTIKSGVITDTMVSATAAIAVTKLAALSSSLAVVTNGSGVLTTSTTTATQIGYLANVTSDVQTQLNGKLSLSGGTMSGAINMGGNAITSLSTPVNPNDGVNKSYVDNLVQGISWKNEARVATAGAALPAYTYASGVITASANGALTIDGTAVAANDRVLVKDETGGNAPNNGIYVVTAPGSGSAPYVLTRSADAATGSSLVSAAILISEGTVNSDTAWVCNTIAPITIGTTNISFVAFPGAGSLTAGTALARSGNVLNVQVDGSTINVNGSNQLIVGTGGITNTQISASAAIAYSKMAALATSQVLISNASGVLVAGDGTVNAQLVTNTLSRGKSTAALVQQEYIDAITLAANGTTSPTGLQFAVATFTAIEISYSMTQATTGDVRVGTIRCVANSTASTLSISETYTETADIGISVAAALATGTVTLTFTNANATNASNMRADVKRFRT